MDLLFSPLFSGSSGNAVFVGEGEDRILVDAGVSCARIVKELESIGVKPESLKAILITHEHTDHTNAAGILSRKYDLPSTPPKAHGAACRKKSAQFKAKTSA